MTELTDYLNTLLKNNFKVFVRKESTAENRTYAYFSLENKIGYVQVNSPVGFSFTSVHKPNSGTGTGYRIHTDIYKPTINHALDSFVFAPEWASPNEMATIKKYKDIEELMSQTIIKDFFIEIKS